MTQINATTPEGQPGDAGSSPLVRLQRVVVTFIRGLFAQCPPGAYHWDPNSAVSQDQEGSEIWVGTDTPINPEIVAKRPAVVVSRGPASFQGIGLGDQAYTDMATGASVKMDMIPTTLVIHVLSRIPVEAEQLAWFIAKHIWLLRSEMMRGNSFILYTGQRPSLSPPSAAGSLVGGPDVESDWIVVTIQMPVHLQHMEVAYPLGKTVVGTIKATTTIVGSRGSTS